MDFIDPLRSGASKNVVSGWQWTGFVDDVERFLKMFVWGTTAKVASVPFIVLGNPVQRSS